MLLYTSGKQSKGAGYFSMLHGGVAMIKTWNFPLSLAAIFLFTAVTVQAEPVITITGAEISPQFPEPGDQVTASFTVKNVGDLTTTCPPVTLAMDIYSSTEYGNPDTGDFVAIPPEDIGTLLPNQEVAISATVPLNHEGRHTASAVINNEFCQLGEMPVLERYLRKSFHVTRPADLVMDGFKLNREGRLVLTMHNAGAAIPDDHFQASTIRVKIGANTYTHYLRNADPSGRLKKANRPGFGLNRVRYVWPATGPHGIVLPRAEKHKIEGTVDHNNSVNDHRRSNNTKVNFVGGLPDLVVCFKKFNHSPGGKHSWYSPVVKNIGNARSGTANLRFYIQNKGGTNHSIPTIPAGGEYTGIKRKIYWAKRGNHTFKLNVDNQHKVDELHENNNIINGNICVGPWWPGKFDRCGLASETMCSDAPGMADTNW